MRRGEIRAVDLGSTVGSEANRRRPCIVVTNDRANQAVDITGRGVVVVVPMTSNVTRVPRYQVFMPAEETGLALDSKAEPDHVRSVSVERVGEQIGRVPRALMADLDDALRLQLAL